MSYFFVLMTLFSFAQIGFAQDYSDPLAEDEIIVEKPTDLAQNYRDRRNRFGAIFSVNYEKFYPKKYLSLIQNETFDQMSGGDSIPIIVGEFGLKFNIELGSLSALISYGDGRYANESQKIDLIRAKITKVALNLSLDNLMSEPWVVPYGQIGANQIDWLEESRDNSGILSEESFKTDWGLNYKIGLLFQLNWLENSIDPNTHSNGLISSGLQNTFLDIFYTSYAEPSEVATAAGQTGEANLKSDHFGVGLKLEF